ncbi:unnamed protein product [Candida verbasci]|uniref:Cyclin-like domain-containing protein n=1 Tax=Candida verbasci TaxID=1227364 RepID=A0A9W4TYB2_9ASCO|nr:unnamed protein product [Candida verbasci]
MISLDKPMMTPKSIKQSRMQQQTLNPDNSFSSVASASSSEPKEFKQELYSSDLYQSEISTHNQNLQEYNYEIRQIMYESSIKYKPKLQLYKQQPYVTFEIRSKLIDFLLKMSVRLKILPFVFFKAVKIFDRYCSKRIVLLDQSQLIITTCLWLASKITGGNNHFVNLNNLDKIGGNKHFKIVNDLGYGNGGKYIGPTERFRLPKLNELVKLCGNKCKYDVGMFKQMELHILNTLNWSINEMGIEEFIIQSNEFNIIDQSKIEIFKLKEYLSYVSLYSSELFDVNTIELSQVILNLTNEIVISTDPAIERQILNCPPVSISFENYKFIKKNLIKSIFNASDYLKSLFIIYNYTNYLIKQIINQYKVNIPTDNNSNTITTPINNTYECNDYVSSTKTTFLQLTPKKRNKIYQNYKSSPKKLHTNSHSNCSSSDFQLITPPNSANSISSIQLPNSSNIQNYQFLNNPNFQNITTTSSPPTRSITNNDNKLSILTSFNGSTSTISSQSSSYNNNNINNYNDIFENPNVNHFNLCGSNINNNASTPLSENESPIFLNKKNKSSIV